MVSVDQVEFERLMAAHPREKGETLVDWFDRLMARADDEARERFREALPYREPGEDDE